MLVLTSVHVCSKDETDLHDGSKVRCYYKYILCKLQSLLEVVKEIY